MVNFLRSQPMTKDDMKKLEKLSQSFRPPSFNQLTGTFETGKDTTVHRRPLVGLESKYFFSMKDWIDGI